MRKHISLILTVMMILTLSATVALATNDSGMTQIAANSVRVNFPDGQPYVDANGRSMTPVRFIAEKLGAKVLWDPASKSVKIDKGDIHIVMPIGKKTFSVTNGSSEKVVEMDTEAIIKDDGRTYVPIRYVAEALGAYVDWSSYYNIADVILPEADLDASDIKRLRSYDLSQTTVIASDLVDEHPEWESFTGRRAFANAHYSLIMLDDTTQEIRDAIYAKKIAPVGTNSYDFANFIVDVAEAETAALYKESGAKTEFISDVSLTYHQKAADYTAVSVRGILRTTITQNNGNFAELAKLYGEKELEIGKTYEADYEITYTLDGSNLVRANARILS